jgi:hypothetical protein
LEQVKIIEIKKLLERGVSIQFKNMIIQPAQMLILCVSAKFEKQFAQILPGVSGREIKKFFMQNLIQFGRNKKHCGFVMKNQWGGKIQSVQLIHNHFVAETFATVSRDQMGSG